MIELLNNDALMGELLNKVAEHADDETLTSAVTDGLELMVKHWKGSRYDLLVALSDVQKAVGDNISGIAAGQSEALSIGEDGLTVSRKEPQDISIPEEGFMLPTDAITVLVHQASYSAPADTDMDQGYTETAEASLRELLNILDEFPEGDNEDGILSWYRDRVYPLLTGETY